jgi:predicted ATPase
MLYLESFLFPDDGAEFDFCLTIKRKCYNTYYPFKVLSRRFFERIDFEPITLLYGSNGSGKSTALHVIAGKLGLPMGAYNRSNFFEDYLALCTSNLCAPLPEGSEIIRSDDVFDGLLSIRTLNEQIDTQREALFDEYLTEKHAHFQLSSMADYEQLRRVNRAHKWTQSRFTREHLMGNVRERSNGESAYWLFTQKIQENALYLLDEPENSLSPALQIDLARFIADSARFFGCQFVISTHSPFFLSLPGAKIYDLDADPVDVKRWTQLKNVRDMYDFFQSHQREFEDED